MDVISLFNSFTKDQIPAETNKFIYKYIHDPQFIDCIYKHCISCHEINQQKFCLLILNNSSVILPNECINDLIDCTLSVGDIKLLDFSAKLYIKYRVGEQCMFSNLENDDNSPFIYFLIIHYFKKLLQTEDYLYDDSDDMIFKLILYLIKFLFKNFRKNELLIDIACDMIMKISVELDFSSYNDVIMNVFSDFISSIERIDDHLVTVLNMIIEFVRENDYTINNDFFMYFYNIFINIENIDCSLFEKEFFGSLAYFLRKYIKYLPDECYDSLIYYVVRCNSYSTEKLQSFEKLGSEGLTEFYYLFIECIFDDDSDDDSAKYYKRIFLSGLIDGIINNIGEEIVIEQLQKYLYDVTLQESVLSILKTRDNIYDLVLIPEKDNVFAYGQYLTYDLRNLDRNRESIIDLFYQQSYISKLFAVEAMLSKDALNSDIFDDLQVELYLTILDLSRAMTPSSNCIFKITFLMDKDTTLFVERYNDVLNCSWQYIVENRNRNFVECVVCFLMKIYKPCMEELIYSFFIDLCSTIISTPDDIDKAILILGVILYQSHVPIDKGISEDMLNFLDNVGSYDSSKSFMKASHYFVAHGLVKGNMFRRYVETVFNDLRSETKTYSPSFLSAVASVSPSCFFDMIRSKSFWMNEKFWFIISGLALAYYTNSDLIHYPDQSITHEFISKSLRSKERCLLSGIDFVLYILLIFNVNIEINKYLASIVALRKYEKDFDSRFHLEGTTYFDGFNEPLIANLNFLHSNPVTIFESLINEQMLQVQDVRTITLNIKESLEKK